MKEQSAPPDRGHPATVDSHGYHFGAFRLVEEPEEEASSTRHAERAGLSDPPADPAAGAAGPSTSISSDSVARDVPLAMEIATVFRIALGRYASASLGSAASGRHAGSLEQVVRIR